MAKQKTGLVVEIVEGESLAYNGHATFDLATTSLKRLAYLLAEELGPRGVTALAVAPGFMRTEQVLDHFGATEATWREVAESSAEARGFGLAGSETPCFVGRAVAALAADPHVARWNGGVFGSWELADAYGFTDADGASPRWGAYFAANFPQYASAVPNSGRRWAVVG
jgi:NAD(P)-dependent dehydrogenase (short-subunit alcohol dehydrogenase family)